MNVYTLRHFRANTKQAFDDAFQGHEVVIERGRQRFQLVALAGDTLPKHKFESVPTKAPVIKSPEDIKIEPAGRGMFNRSGFEPLYRNKKKGKL